ncbi:MAG: YceI family protein [Salinibacter sp.]
MRTQAWSIGSLIGLVIGLLLFPDPALGQEKRLTVHAKSQFQIQGNATVRNFTCVVEQVQGRARLPAPRDTIPETVAKRQTQAIVQVPVQEFDCGNDRMTDDLQETLKMDEHPEIRFDLVHATVGAPTDTARQWRTVNAIGALTISGKKRLVRLEAAGYALDAEHFRLRGCKPLEMTDFNVDPPKKAFGLIRVKDRVEAQFDLLAYTEEGSAAALDSLRLRSPPTC